MGSYTHRRKQVRYPALASEGERPGLPGPLARPALFHQEPPGGLNAQALKQMDQGFDLMNEDVREGFRICQGDLF